VIAVDPADVIPLTQFPLAWRFTDERWVSGGADARRDVRPVTSARAAALHGPLVAAFHEAREAVARHVPAACQDEAGARRIAVALAELPAVVAERVVVSWDQSTALETSWLTFRENWEIFCYPGADDVIISPLDERWLLCYHHWEEFTFTARRAGPPR
jgi:hypothetical protein